MNTQQAKQIKIADYLQNIGINPKYTRNENLWYCSPFRQEQTPSFKVDMRINAWYDHGLGIGGNLLDLVMRLHNLSNVSDALAHLAGKSIKQNNSFFFQKQKKTTSNITNVQVSDLSNPILIAYIKSRHINLDLAQSYCKEINYQANGKNFFSIGFKNDMGGYELSNATGVKIAIAPKAPTSSKKDTDICLVFEGFWDFLSFLQLKNTKEIPHSFVVLNSVANLSKAIDFIKAHSKVYTYLDNDEAGRKATQQIKSVCSSCLDQAPHYAKYKDFNDFLKSRKQKQSKQQSKGRKL